MLPWHPQIYFLWLLFRFVFMIGRTPNDQLTLVRFSASLDYVNSVKETFFKDCFYTNRFCWSLLERFKYILVFVDGLVGFRLTHCTQPHENTYNANFKKKVTLRSQKFYHSGLSSKSSLVMFCLSFLVLVQFSSKETLTVHKETRSNILGFVA